MPKNDSAIVLNLEDTLIYCVTYKNDIKSIFLRPNFDMLISKLEYAKSQNIDIILYTSMLSCEVNKILKSYSKFDNLFDEVICGDTEENFIKKAIEIRPDLEVNKIYLSHFKQIALMDYKKILLIDDTADEFIYGQVFWETEVDITVVRILPYVIPFSIEELFLYRQLMKKSKRFLNLLYKYIKFANTEPGCKLMCRQIDSFLNKSFEKGMKYVNLQRNIFSRLEVWEKSIDKEHKKDIKLIDKWDTTESELSAMLNDLCYQLCKNDDFDSKQAIKYYHQPRNFFLTNIRYDVENLLGIDRTEEFIKEVIKNI